MSSMVEKKFITSAISALSLTFLLRVCDAAGSSIAAFNLKEIERSRIIAKAAKYLNEQPITVTAAHSERSAGGLHDFFSEGDYWWPDANNPDGAYIQHDGLSNPDNFVAHRHAMVRLSEIIGTLTSAYILTQEDRYAGHAVKHLKAWFVDEDTKMSPNLL